MTAISASMIVLGSLFAAGSVVFIVAGRKDRTGPKAPQTPGWVLSPMTKVVIGLSLGGCAYHLFGYALPPAWFPLVVPVSRWWIVPTVAAVAVLGSLAADRLDRR